MRFNIKRFQTFSDVEWDALIEDMNGSKYQFTFKNISYYSAFKNNKNYSFCVVDEKKIIAVIAVLINTTNKKNLFFFDNFIVPKPIFHKKINNSLRRKVFNFIIDHLKELAIKNNISHINFMSHPIYFINNKPSLDSQNQFELLSFNVDYKVHNTLIHDLSNLTYDEMISSLSKYHRKNINKISYNKDISFINLNYRSNKNNVEKHFKNFKNLHFKSAGKKTRPDKTWKIMLEKIFDNSADLFAIKLKSTAISYLNCGKFKNFAWGWSQVNSRIYEKKYMPRHILEWKAMLYYKDNNIEFYEIGERYFAQKNFEPSKKEISISEFKEKYGANYYPKPQFRLKFNFQRK